MKLVHRTITTLGIVTLLGLLTHTVKAQPALQRTTTLISQLNTGGLSHPPVGIHSGNFTYPGGGSFYNGNLRNQGSGIYQGSFYNPSGGSIYQGTFYNPTYGGNFHGLFYDPHSGRVIQGNFYNPGSTFVYPGNTYNPGFYPAPSATYQGNYNPGPTVIYPGNFYNQELSCYNNRSLHDWGNGCFSQPDYRRAIAYYDQVIRKNPKLVDAYNKRALARFILGDRQGTIADLQKAASLYLAQGDQSRYQQTIETIREIQPERAGGTRTR